MESIEEGTIGNSWARHVAIWEDLPPVGGQKALSSGTLRGPGTKDIQTILDSNQACENAVLDSKKSEQSEQEAGRQPKYSQELRPQSMFGVTPCRVFLPPW